MVSFSRLISISVVDTDEEEHILTLTEEEARTLVQVLSIALHEPDEG